MKAVLTFLVLFIFWLNAIFNDSVSGKRIHKVPAKQKTAVAGNTNVIKADSVSNYSINVNGGSNSVRITSDAPAGKSLETDAKRKNKPNSIEINCEGNSVNIHQNENGGKVNIQQNGNGNQVSISQTNQNPVK